MPERLSNADEQQCKGGWDVGNGTPEAPCKEVRTLVRA